MDQELEAKKYELYKINSDIDKLQAEYIKLVELIGNKKLEMELVEKDSVNKEIELKKIIDDIESQKKLLIDVDFVVDQKKQEVEDYKKIEIDLIEKRRSELLIREDDFTKESLGIIEEINTEKQKLKEDKMLHEINKTSLYNDYDLDTQKLIEKEKELAIREENVAILEGELDAKQIELNNSIEYSYVSQNNINLLLGEIKQQKTNFEEYKKNEEIKIKALRENTESHLETNRLLAKKEYDEIIDGLKEQQVEINKENEKYEKLCEACIRSIEDYEHQENILQKTKEEYKSKIQDLEKKLKDITDKENGIDIQRKQLDTEIAKYVKLREDLLSKYK